MPLHSMTLTHAQQRQPRSIPFSAFIYVTFYCYSKVVPQLLHSRSSHPQFVLVRNWTLDHTNSIVPARANAITQVGLCFSVHDDRKSKIHSHLSVFALGQITSTDQSILYFRSPLCFIYLCNNTK